MKYSNRIIDIKIVNTIDIMIVRLNIFDTP